MKRTFIKESFLTILATLFCLAASFGQTTITTGTITPSPACAGGEISVPFTTTGLVAPLTSFIAQLSDAAGAFGAPVEIGNAAASPITATIPGGAAAGSDYKIRVISKLVAATIATGSESALTVNAVPAAPTVTTPVNYVQGASAIALTATPATGLLWYTGPTGGTGESSKIPLTDTPGTTSYYVSQTVGTCEGPRAKIDVVVTACTPPAKPTVTTPVNYVVNATPSALQATFLGGATQNWYGPNATGGTAVTAPTVPPTNAVGTISYYVSQTVAGCESERAKIDVVVSACTPPAKPTVTTPVNYVFNATPSALQATFLVGATQNWYGPNATGGTAVTAPTVPSTNAVGTISYYVSQTVAGCESERAKIDVVVSACTPPAKPTVVTPVNYEINKPASALQATFLPGAIKNWYGTNATGGSASPNAPTPATNTIGTTSYYVSQTVNSCESERAKIDVVVSACTPPTKPTVVTPVNYVVNKPASALQATFISGATKNWYGTSATGGTASTTAPTPSTNVIGTTSYYVSQTVDGCESERAKIDVIISACTPPAAPKTNDVEYCINAATSLLTATGTGLKWYSGPTGGIGSTSAPKPTSDSPGETFYYVSQTIDACESPRAGIKVTIKKTNPPGVADIDYCQSATATASPLSATGTGLIWYANVAGGTALPSAPVPSIKTVGKTKYYVSQTVNGCESERVSISIEIKSTPAPAVAAVTYCQNDKPAVLTATGTGLKWYNASIGGTQYASAPTPTTIKDGTASYYVSQTVSACESPRAKLDVVVNATPSAVTPFSKDFCQERADQTFTFPTQASTGNTLKWYTVKENGTPITSPSINLKEAKTSTYYVAQITSLGCENKDRSEQKVLVKPLPGVPGLPQPLIEYCQFIPAKQLEATAVTNATLNWFGTDASGGTSSPSAPTPSTAEGGTTSYYVAQTLAGCLGDRAKIDVKVNTTPKPTTKTYLEYCQNAPATALDATGTVLKWYREANGTDWQGIPFIPFTAKVEDYSFYVTQTGSNGCESPKEEIKIHIRALPSATISGNSTIDLGQTATVNIKFTGEAPWAFSLSNGLTDTTDQANHNVQVKPSTTTSYLLAGVENICGKGTIAGLAVVTVKVPTINSGSASVSDVCAGKPFIVPFQQSGDFPAGNTFKLQVSKENADAKFYTIQSIATANSVSATFPDTTKGGAYFYRIISSGANPDFTVKGSVSPVTINATPLPVATLTGTQTILVGETADLKADITGKGPWTITLNNGTKDTLITANATPFTFKLAPKTTTTYAITKVTNGCGIGTGVGTARVQVDPILGVEPPAPADWAKVYPTVINGKCTVEVTGTISPKQASIEVVDLNGRARSTQAIRQQKTEVDFANYPSGLYLLRIQNGNLSTVQRVMKP